MSDYGIIASKSGSSVSSATLDELCFLSSYPLFKINTKQNWEITTSVAGSGSYTYNHDLGYVPYYEVWGEKWDNPGSGEYITYSNYGYAIVGTDENDITVSIIAGTPSSTFSGYLLVCLDELPS